MHSVFVAGSRALSRLNPQIRERLDNIIERNVSVLIGDANGADKAVQQYLAKRQYRQVIVYCMEICRNNIGGWPMRCHVAKPGAKRDRHYYGIKDAAMVKDATCGLMLWDGLSKGTLTSAINLLSADKKVVFYIAPKKQSFNLRNFEDLHQALSATGVRDIPRFLVSMGINQPGAQHLPWDTTPLVVPR